MSALTCWLASWVLFAPVLDTLANGGDEPLTWGHVIRDCAPLAAFFLLLFIGMGVGAYIKEKRGRRRAEKMVGEALLQAGQHADVQTTQSLLQDALRAFPGLDSPDLERVADRIQVSLSDALRTAFRQAELKYLEELLASPEHLPKRVEGAAIRVERSGDMNNPSITAFAGGATPALGIEVTERTADGRRTLDVLLTVHASRVSFSGVMTHSGAFSPGELPKDEEVVALLQGDKRIKSDIARRFKKDVGGVMGSIVNFVRGRRLMDELDEVVVHVRKYVTVYWLEHVTSLVSLVGGATYRTHFWLRFPVADYTVGIDMAPLSSTGRVPWDFKEEQVRFEYVPV